jgi:uncharacterized protein (TIGR02646 family)
MKKLAPMKLDWHVARELVKYAKRTKAREPWASGKKIAKEFKNEFTRQMLVEQGKKCAYCGSRLFEKHPHRDHIAPKEQYRKWTFWPENLVLSCFACNTDSKKTYDPVKTVGKSYRKTEFTFIHPYLDDPTEHLVPSIAGLKILLSPRNESAKGKETIRLFDLMSPERAKQRAQESLAEIDEQSLGGILKEQYVNAATAILENQMKMKLGGQ